VCQHLLLLWVPSRRTCPAAQCSRALPAIQRALPVHPSAIHVLWRPAFHPNTYVAPKRTIPIHTFYLAVRHILSQMRTPGAAHGGLDGGEETYSKTRARRIASYYSTSSKPKSTPKSTPAGPATTRADVHVIAIAPSRNTACTLNDESLDPATPSTQIVESNSGCHAIVWKGLPSEHVKDSKPRTSSATYSLQAVNPTAARSLQRVNTKLTDWSGSKPTDGYGT
jgi:hypothetical protein